MAKVEIGYKLSSEDHGAMDLVRYARRAEEIGFSFALISDHYLPWTNRQGQSPFVWCVLGGIAEATERLGVGTGVTCPTIRIHPAIIAQVAATAATMLPGRFFLGVGSGENLNEHVLGDRWPSTAVRHEMLEEAVALIRQLWDGGPTPIAVPTTRSRTPASPPCPRSPHPSSWLPATRTPPSSPAVSATGSSRPVLTQSSSGAYAATGHDPRPRYAELKVCWAETEAEALRQAHTWWPNLAVPEELGQELPAPAHFEQAASLVREGDIAEAAICGPDRERHLEGINAFVSAGFDHICVHQVGPDQEGFCRFYEREVLPRLG